MGGIEKQKTGRRGERPPLRLAPAWLAFPGTFVVAIGTAAVVLYAGLQLLDVRDLKTEPQLTSKTLFDLVKLAFGVVAGAGGLVALVVAYRRQRIDEATALRESTKLHTDRFTAAVAQLGDANPAVQLGGVHALAGLADDAPTRALRQTCIDVLCAYLRLPYTAGPGPLSENQHTTLTEDEREAYQQRLAAYRGLREVRHTIIRLIGNHLRLEADDPRSWQGHDFDFTDAVLDGGDLTGANFTTGTTATFARATFTHDFTFQGARFSGGTVTFEGAEFSGGAVGFGYATFSGGTVNFGHTRFSGGEVTFGNAHFSGGTVSFEFAHFSGGTVSFGAARFSDGTVGFGAARFSGGAVRFEFAHFSGSAVRFKHTTFTGGTVNFGHTRFSGGEVTFWNAEFSGGTVGFEFAHFSGGTVHFVDAHFSGGTVGFGYATFSGGTVDFQGAGGVMPAGLLGADGGPAAGVLLPDGWLQQGG